MQSEHAGIATEVPIINFAAIKNINRCTKIRK